jgi:hypothetical protein
MPGQAGDVEGFEDNVWPSRSFGFADDVLERRVLVRSEHRHRLNLHEFRAIAEFRRLARQETSPC